MKAQTDGAYRGWGLGLRQLCDKSEAAGKPLAGAMGAPVICLAQPLGGAGVEAPSQGWGALLCPSGAQKKEKKDTGWEARLLHKDRAQTANQTTINLASITGVSGRPAKAADTAVSVGRASQLPWLAGLALDLRLTQPVHRLCNTCSCMCC